MTVRIERRFVEVGEIWVRRSWPHDGDITVLAKVGEHYRVLGPHQAEVAVDDYVHPAWAIADAPVKTDIWPAVETWPPPD